MKKIYLSPAIETIELRFSPMMTDPLSSGSGYQGGSGNSFGGGGGGAPGRKPF